MSEFARGYAAALVDVENDLQRLTQDENTLVTQADVLAVVRLLGSAT